MAGRWLVVTSVVGKLLLIYSGAVLLLTMLVLAVYALRRGKLADGDVRPSMQPFGPRAPLRQAGFAFYKGRSKLKMLIHKERFITIGSLVDGSATRAEWAVVIVTQVALVSFWFVFLGAALTLLAGTKGLSLLLPAIVGLWLAGILTALWKDLVAARKKLARSRQTRRPG